MRKGYSAVLRRILGSVLAACLPAAVSVGEPIESSPDARPPTLWSFAGADGGYRIEDWALSSSSSVSRPNAEAGEFEDTIELVTADATTVYLAFPIPPSAVIDELQLAVPVFSSRPGLQLVAEVVLPRAIEPGSGRPLRAMAYGSSYSTPGAWQRLELNDLPDELRRGVWALQLANKTSIDSRGAYVDRVLIRVRPGRGASSLRLRKVDVQGNVSVNPSDGTPSLAGQGVVRTAGRNLEAGWDRPSRARETPRTIELTGGVLHVDGTPVFPKAVEFSGGPLRRAAELGYNVVVLPSPPTREQERDAQRCGLWLICPPPSSEVLTARSEMAVYRRVVAWHLGRRLQPVDLEPTREWASVIRRLDPARGRPLIASVDYGHRAFSRVLDVVVLEPRPLCGSVSLQQFGRELASQRRLVLPGKAVWMLIQTRLPAEVTDQARSIMPGNLQSLNIRPPADQISRLTWMALAHGMLGLIFEAPPHAAQVEQRDPTSTELSLIARQLDLLDPLLVRTGTTRRVVDLGGGLHAGVLSNGRSHCVLPWRHDDSDQVIPPSAAMPGGRGAPPLSFVVPGIAEPSEAHLVTTTDTTRLTMAREAGGVRVTMESLLPRDFVLLTQDVMFAQRLKGLAAASGAQMANYERALLAGDAARFGGGRLLPPTGGADLRSARRALAVERRRRIGDRPNAVPARSSPLDRVPETYEADLRLATLDRRPLPTPNLLPGADFEGVEASRQSGWQHIQLAGQENTHEIELATGNARSGSFCVRIFSRDVADRAVVEAGEPSVWLASPRVPLNGGDVIRITGWVRGGPKRDGDAWAFVEDSLGGRPLSLRIAASDQWQPFVMYRATEMQHEWSVRLASCGTGDVYFDGLAVQRLPAEALRQLFGAAPTRDSRRVLFDAPVLRR